MKMPFFFDVGDVMIANWSQGLISLKYTFIGWMTSYLSREIPSFSVGGERKKLKHYSFSSSDKIGKGFSSIVYRGINEHTKEAVAIKAIDMKGVRDAVSREMLDCQIEALTKLKHPNILKCYDVIRDPAHCYIITQYCNEGDLSSLLKKKRKISEEEVVVFMKHIVEGFLEMADNKFLHRDMKLANIFINSGMAKIADFGFAKKSHSSFEKEKYNVGSPLYMSPQALKKNIYSIKNDIWSIGIIVYELLHGQTPWQCKTESQLIDKMTRVPVRFRESIPVSKETKQFIKKCLEVDESKRMSVSELKQWVGKYPDSRSKSNSVQEKKISPPSTNEVKVCESSKIIKPLGDATNRISLGVEKNRSYSNVYQKNSIGGRKESSYASRDKQNVGIEERKKMPKSIIDSNNNILLIQINRFRLNYKIYEKLKLLICEDKTILHCLANNILKKVDIIYSLLLSSDSSKVKSIADELGLKDVDLYLREQTNMGIKKYRSVIKEYHKKYNFELQPKKGVEDKIEEQFKKFLLTYKWKKQTEKEDSLLRYWLTESTNLKSDIKKDELDSIIEGKPALVKFISTERS